MQPTFRPSNKKKHSTHGFRKRMSTPGGKKVLSARRAKGRYRIAVRTRRKGHYR